MVDPVEVEAPQVAVWEVLVEHLEEVAAVDLLEEEAVEVDRLEVVVEAVDLLEEVAVDLVAAGRIHSLVARQSVKEKILLQTKAMIAIVD